MADDTIDTALENLSAIKEGEAVASLDVAVNEVNRLFEECDATDSSNRDRLHVGVARWKRRNGVCKYNCCLDGQRRFGKRMSSLPRRHGHCTVVINERILESGDEEGFIDTVRHEVAHAVAYWQYGGSQKHNHNWKRIARRLGADPSACHNKKKTDHKYYIGCPECGTMAGRTRLCKVIKQPFNRMCGKCGHGGMVSFDGDKEMPSESGVVDVDKLDYSDRDGWWEAGCP